MADSSNHTEMIVVLDFGSQYNQLITRTIRELGVYSELHPHTATAEEIRKLNAKGIIFSGGLNSVHGEGAFTCDEKIFELGIPVLGIGSGMHFMALHFGGNVEPYPVREYGEAEIQTEGRNPLFKNMPESHKVWINKGDKVAKVPEGFTVYATSSDCPVAAMGNERIKMFGIQFHPEVEQSVHGKELLKNFLFDVCGCEGNWSVEHFIDIQVENIRRTVGDKSPLRPQRRVDSSVVAVLTHKAIGDQLTCMFVDHGLLRKGEAESVMKTFREKFRMNVIKLTPVNAFKQIKRRHRSEQNGKLSAMNLFMFLMTNPGN